MEEDALQQTVAEEPVVEPVHASGEPVSTDGLTRVRARYRCARLDAGEWFRGYALFCDVCSLSLSLPLSSYDTLTGLCVQTEDGGLVEQVAPPQPATPEPATPQDEEATVRESTESEHRDVLRVEQVGNTRFNHPSC
jgi:hypothetical protein